MPQHQTETGQSEPQNFRRTDRQDFRRFRNVPGGRPGSRFWGPWMAERARRFGGGHFGVSAFAGPGMGPRPGMGIQRMFPGPQQHRGLWNQPGFQNRFGGQDYEPFPRRNFPARNAEGSPWENQDRDPTRRNRQTREQVWDQEFGGGQFRGQRIFPALRRRNRWWNQPAFGNRFGGQRYGSFPGGNFAAKNSWENQDQEEFGGGQFRGQQIFTALRRRNRWWHQPAFGNRFGGQRYGSLPGRNFAARSAGESQGESEHQNEPRRGRQTREQVKEGRPSSNVGKQKRRKRPPGGHNQNRQE